MQKVQRWSQPVWIWMKARVRSSKPSIRWLAVSSTCMMSRTWTGSAAPGAKLAGSIFSMLPITRSTSAMPA